MISRVQITLTLLIALAGCATVRQADLDAWVGQPIVALETHPVFLTIPVVKTVASDGTEIWNFVNGVNLGQCSGGGNVYGKQLSYASYNQFASCVQRFAACNNIFYIRDGKVQRYTPVGSGGMRCYTTEQIQPQFRGPTNIR
ncbi:MAG: hypothetical protein Q8K50_07160 [Hydrogenophaga sp.]|nr:hypothetical protein [Hydrogenophaga sp.]